METRVDPNSLVPSPLLSYLSGFSRHPPASPSKGSRRTCRPGHESVSAACACERAHNARGQAEMGGVGVYGAAFGATLESPCSSRRLRLPFRASSFAVTILRPSLSTQQISRKKMVRSVNWGRERYALCSQLKVTGRSLGLLFGTGAG